MESIKEEKPIIKEAKAPKAKTKGIVLIALGFPEYGQMAYNLALSIRNNSKSIDITIFSDDDSLVSLSEEKKAIFNKIVVPKKEDYTNSATGAITPMKLKLDLYNYSPYDQTLYLDADIIGFRDTDWDKFLNGLEGSVFNILNEGYYDSNGEDKRKGKYGLWANYEDVIASYGSKGKMLESKLFAFRSEVMYFEKCELMKEFFELAKSINQNPKCKVEGIASGLPDEFSFNVAAAILGIEPKNIDWNPVHWWFVHGDVKTSDRGTVLNKYIALSVGGKFIPTTIKQFYNSLANYHHEKVGLKNTWEVRDKKSFAPKTRAKI